MRREILLSPLLSFSLLSANAPMNTDIPCKDGKCFIDLSKFKKNDKVVPFNNIDENVIRLPHEKYVMTKIEKEKYELEHMEREDLLKILTEINAMDVDESTLPVSEEYCDLANTTYNSELDIYECG